MSITGHLYGSCIVRCYVNNYSCVILFREKFCGYKSVRNFRNKFSFIPKRGYNHASRKRVKEGGHLVYPLTLR